MNRFATPNVDAIEIEVVEFLSGDRRSGPASNAAFLIGNEWLLWADFKLLH
jgi:hypothetical protein